MSRPHSRSRARLGLPGSRSVSPISASRRARSRRGSISARSDRQRGRRRRPAAAPAVGLPRRADEEGLARSCARGRELGHLGRTAIHPAQLPVIEQAYLPTADEVERARATLAQVEEEAPARSRAASSSTRRCSGPPGRPSPWSWGRVRVERPAPGRPRPLAVVVGPDASASGEIGVRKEAAHLQLPLGTISLACRAAAWHDTAASFAHGTRFKRSLATAGRPTHAPVKRHSERGLRQAGSCARITASSRLWTPSCSMIADMDRDRRSRSRAWPRSLPSSGRRPGTGGRRAGARSGAARPGPRPLVRRVCEPEDAHDRAVLSSCVELISTPNGVPSAARMVTVASVESWVPSSFAANSCRASAAYAGSTIWVIRFAQIAESLRGGGVQPANSGVAVEDVRGAPSASRSRERGQARSGGARRCSDRRRPCSGMRRS